MGLSKEEKELIMVHLKLHLAESAWDNISLMLSEAYYITLYNQKCIALRPALFELGGSMVFSTLTGEFMDIMSWEDVQKEGIKI